jgi:hypothetical protein
MSIPGLLIIAVMVGFFVMCAIRMGPHYFEYLSVREIVATAAREYNPEEDTIADIRRRLDTMFNTNQIKDLQVKDIDISHKDGRTFIDARYEARVPIAGSISAIMSFDDLEVEAGTKNL